MRVLLSAFVLCATGLLGAAGNADEPKKSDPVEKKAEAKADKKSDKGADEKKSEKKETEPKEKKADETERPAGTGKGVPASFRMFVCWDKRFDPKDELNRTGRLHDPVGEYGLAPVIAVFSRTIPMKADSPVSTLIQEQDRLAQKYKPLRMGAFTGFLALTKDFPDDPDRDLRITEVTNVARQANPALVVVGVAEATVEENGKAVPSPQAADWKIAEDDDITVVFYYRFEIINRWAFKKDKPPTVEDIDNIASEVDKLLGPKIVVPKRKK